MTEVKANFKRSIADVKSGFEHSVLVLAKTQDAADLKPDLAATKILLESKIMSVGLKQNIADLKSKL